MIIGQKSNLGSNLEFRIRYSYYQDIALITDYTIAPDDYCMTSLFLYLKQIYM
jgi:hypothetical protein